MEVTYILHISTWIFSMCWKIPPIGQTSYYWFSTFLHANYHVTSIPVRVTLGYLPQFYMEYFQYNEKYPTEGCYLYIPHLHIEYFLCVKKFHQEDGHPGMDFLNFHIQFIKSPLYKRSWPIYCTFLHGFFFYMLKNSTNRTVILLSIFHILL